MARARPSRSARPPSAVAAALAKLGPPPLALHALLEDPDPRREAIAGIALSSGGGAASYIPFGGAAWEALVPWLADARASKLGHDLVATTIALHHAGVVLAGVVGDSQHASHLTQPSNWAPHDLPLVAKHVLGRALPADEVVRGVGAKRKRWAQLPVERAADAAASAADATAEIWRALAPGVDPALLSEYLALTAVLVRMELRGIVVDRDELARAETAFAEIEAELSAQIEQLAGHAFNVNSTKQLGEVLFAELKLPIASHTKTGWSTATEALEKIEHAHPIVPLVIRWRLLRRLRDSWLIALRRCIDGARRPRALALPSGALVLRPPGQHEPRSRARARPHAGDGAHPARVRRRAGPPVDVGRLQPARPLRPRAPDARSRARRAAAARRRSARADRGRGRRSNRTARGRC